MSNGHKFGGPRGQRGPSQADIEAQKALAMGNFKRLFDAGQVKVLDRFGRELKANQYVLFKLRDDLIWEIESITVDEQRMGYLNVNVACQIPVVYPAGNKANDLIIVGEKNAEGTAVITGPQDGTIVPEEIMPAENRVVERGPVDDGPHSDDEPSAQEPIDEQ